MLRRYGAIIFVVCSVLLCGMFVQVTANKGRIPRPPMAYAELALAIAIYESDNKDVTSKSGTYVGPMQISKRYVDDANEYIHSRAGKVKGEFYYFDRHDMGRSASIFYCYCMRYEKDNRGDMLRSLLAAAERRGEGTITDDELRARIHNQGGSFCVRLKDEKEERLEQRLADSREYWRCVKSIRDQMGKGTGSPHR